MSKIRWSVEHTNCGAKILFTKMSVMVYVYIYTYECIGNFRWRTVTNNYWALRNDADTDRAAVQVLHLILFLNKIYSYTGVVRP